MFDVFYIGTKPGLFPHERAVDSIEQAKALSQTRYCWVISYLADYSSWDFLWEPAPWQSQYVHVWIPESAPHSWLYLVPKHADKIEYLYHKPKFDTKNFHYLTAAEFDTSWKPDPADPPYIYVFGNQHWPSEIMPTVEYRVPGAVDRKYMDWPLAQLPQQKQNWQVFESIDESLWDWSWVPDPGDPPYIYVFGNQWNPPEFKANVEYHVPGATERKYMERRTVRLPQKHLFKQEIAVGKFDWSWEPNPFDPPYIYVFGNTWYPAEIEPSVTYTVPGATEVKYVHDIVATPWSSMANWEFLDDIVLDSFDWTWHPNPKDPPYIYEFGTNWYAPEIKPVLRYTVPGATQVKYMDAPRAQRCGDPSRFEQLYPCEFDWSWEPDPGSPPYIYVFGNQYYSAEVMPTLTLTVPGATERKYMDIPATLLPEKNSHTHILVDGCEWDYTWRPEPGSPAYIYVFGNQWWSAEKMPTVEYHMPGATERKYMTAPIATLPVDMTHWHIPEHVDVRDMDFSWVPDPGEPPYIYQFATQHQKTGGPQYRVPGATEVKYVDMMRAEVKREAAPIFEIDHLDGNAGQIPNTVKRIRYFDNYRDTLIRLAKSLVGEYEHVWVCSSVCDYTDFDFSWHPETWQGTMLHVFPSDEQKFGDTFYMHVPSFAERAEKKKLLEWYSVNYVPRKRVPRRPMPVFHHSYDSQVDAVKNTEFTAPLALFTVEQHLDQATTTVPLWRQEVKTITPISHGATAVIVPKAAVGEIRTQLYDYPYIDKTRIMLKSQPLDIVFIENGEPIAEANWTRLQNRVIEGLDKNKLHRVSNVNGRAAAYHAAAQASTTPWFFAVFAKLAIDKNFDWSWQPDRMQQAKHYIFHADNPVNGLIYGHQAMIAYNRDLVLSNPGVGLDFTLDSPHEVVPLMSGTAWYTDTPWSTWRTAFRECIKLRASLPDVENEYRLNTWLTKDNSEGQWSQKGAEDAVAYYEEVQGNFDALKKSYEWNWLASYALMRRGLAPDR